MLLKTTQFDKGIFSFISMLAYSDNKDLTYKFLGSKMELLPGDTPIPNEIQLLYHAVFPTNKIQKFKSKIIKHWNYLFLVKHAERSHFDLLIKLNSNNNLPDGIACIAEKGNGFHGFRNRYWNTRSGNIHLSLFFKPKQKFEFFQAGLLSAAAISIIDSIDSIPGLSGLASTKWVNDIYINNRKVAGIITQTFSSGNKISGAVLGIGLNVESTPVITNDKFTPDAGCLKNFTGSDQCNIKNILSELLFNLWKNINMLNSSDYGDLHEKYCNRSSVIGRHAAIYSDSKNGENREIVKGKVISINKNLELILENNAAPINRGRLSLNE